MAGITIYQYNEEAKEYHNDRLIRKEAAVKNHMKYVLRNTTWEEKTERVSLIFRDAIFELAAIHNLKINLYDFEGNLLLSSTSDITETELPKKISPKIIERVLELPASSDNENQSIIERFKVNGEEKQKSYSEIANTKFKPLLILNLEYDIDNKWLEISEINQTKTV
ncbi:MAG: hypothetical protein HRT68_14660 [Flavobacteriaceae bacterium]|nr:hypothetical protein [Flavobacteriaceae bacterium]